MQIVEESENENEAENDNENDNEDKKGDKEENDRKEGIFPSFFQFFHTLPKKKKKTKDMRNKPLEIIQELIDYHEKWVDLSKKCFMVKKEQRIAVDNKFENGSSSFENYFFKNSSFFFQLKQ